MSADPLWVVKLGGSLARSSWLPRWLDRLSQPGPRRVVIVPGGARFCDEVRALQALWHYDDVAAHNQAVLAMAQMAELFIALQPRLARAQRAEDCRRHGPPGGALVWQPLDLLRRQADALTRWDASADSCAAWLAERLQADRLCLVKACAVPPVDIDTLSTLGIVDGQLPERLRRWGGHWQVMSAWNLGLWPDAPATAAALPAPPAQAQPG